jgi:hypothetical protein
MYKTGFAFPELVKAIPRLASVSKKHAAVLFGHGGSIRMALFRSGIHFSCVGTGYVFRSTSA